MVEFYKQGRQALFDRIETAQLRLKQLRELQTIADHVGSSGAENTSALIRACEREISECRKLLETLRL